MHHHAEWLAPGHLLLRRADAGWRLVTPDGAVLEVDDGVIDGGMGLAQLAQQPGPAAATFAAAGFGRPEGKAHRARQARSSAHGRAMEPSGTADIGEVVIAGHESGDLAAALERAVCKAGGTVARWTAPHLVPMSLTSGSPSLVVLCSDTPSDATWIGYEEAMPDGGTQLRVSIEGARVFYEPPAAGPNPVTHRMVRARRLAAAPWPDDLLALWTQDVVCGPALPTADSAALVAGWVLDDITAMCSSSVDPHRGRTLRVLDLYTGGFTDHPVFPVPAGTSWRGV